jgi:hypothetical protein
MRVPAWIRGTLFITVIFAAGFVAGIGYERRHERSHHAVSAHGHEMIHRLATDLDLDPSQQEAVRQILARHQREMDSTWHSMQPHVRATLDTALQEIVAVLRPDQAAKFRSSSGGGHSGTRH